MRYIDLTNCWCITDHITTPSHFVKALNHFAGDSRCLYLEGVLSGQVRESVRAYVIESDLVLDIGSISPTPNSTIHLRMLPKLLELLSDAVEAGKMYIDHIAVYEAGEVLLDYSDAFMSRSIVNISRSFPVEHVTSFCHTLAVACRQGSEVYPEYFD